MRVEWTESFALATTVADIDALATAWAALLHTVLDVAREGDHLEVTLHTPRVRPAIIFEVTLHSAHGVANIDRFLDADWREHPAGQAGAVMARVRIAQRPAARWSADCQFGRRWNGGVNRRAAAVGSFDR